MKQKHLSNDVKENLIFNESANGVIDYTIKYQDENYRIIHINPSIESVKLDLTGYAVVYDTKENDSEMNNYTLTATESIVLSKIA